MIIETYSDLSRKIAEAQFELRKNGLELQGFSLQLEISVRLYNKLSANYWNYFEISNQDDIPSKIFGVPYIITQDTDRLLIAKEILKD